MICDSDIVSITLKHYLCSKFYLLCLILLTVWENLEGVGVLFDIFVQQSEPCICFSPFRASNNFSPQMSISNCHKLLHLIKPNTTLWWSELCVWIWLLFPCCFAEERKVNWWRHKLHCQLHPIDVTIHIMFEDKSQGRHLGKRRIPS